MRDKDVENHHLHEKISFLEKALEKEKKFHRKFADEVAATEAIRLADFKKEKKSYVEEIKTLKKSNSRLAKDAKFYQMAHEELAKNTKSLSTATISCDKRSVLTNDSESQTTSNHQRPSKQKSSIPVVKVNLTLYEEHKNFFLKLLKCLRSSLL